MKAQEDHRLLRGRDTRARILKNVTAAVDAEGVVGRIVSIMIGNTPEVAVYIRGQARSANVVGIRFDEQVWSEAITQDDCKNRIQEMNNDPDVLGIILQRPVPSHINVRSLQSAIHPLKDIEGMNPASIGNIVYNDVALTPCTAAAAVELIHATGLTVEGLEVVIIGHSEIVGKPIAMMLMAEGATVTVCHHMTRSVAMHSRRADVVVVAVGKAHLIGKDMIKPGAAVIDIGINQIENGIVGDVDTHEVLDVAGWVTPVPGGVGPVTTAMLMRNAIVALNRQKSAGWLD